MTGVQTCALPILPFLPVQRTGLPGMVSEKDARLFQIPPVPRLDELVIGRAVQLLPHPSEFEDERREPDSSSDTGDGLRTDRSYLVDSRVAPEPDSGGVRIITGERRDKPVRCRE